MVSWDWVLFPIPDVGSERFRLTQGGGRNLHNGYGLIGSFYSDGDFTGRFGWQRIYGDWDGSRQRIVFSQPFPPELLAAGINTRYLGCSLRSRPVLAGPWNLELEAEILSQSVQWNSVWTVSQASLGKSGDFVEVRGTVNKSDPIIGELIGELPWGFYPAANQFYRSEDQGKSATFEIDTLGRIKFLGGTLPVPINRIFKKQ